LKMNLAFRMGFRATLRLTKPATSFEHQRLRFNLNVVLIKLGK
jgi:hypothetical protein